MERKDRNLIRRLGLASLLSVSLFPQVEQPKHTDLYLAKPSMVSNPESRELKQTPSIEIHAGLGLVNWGYLTDMKIWIPQENFQVKEMTLGEKLGASWESLPQLITINFNQMYNSGEINQIDPLWGEGEEIKEALKNGSDITAVVEMGFEISEEEWKRYIRQISQEYPFPVFIIGNELNDPSNFWHSRPEQYARFFDIAYEEIKAASPTSEIFLYSEAYYGRGEDLTRILGLIMHNRPDGFPIHFYGEGRLFKDRILEYWQILEDLGYSNPKIIVSEVSVPDAVSLTREELALFIAHTLPYLLDVQEEGLVEKIFWFNAFYEDYPYSLVTEEGDTKILETFLQLGSFLYSDIEITSDGNLTQVNAKDNQERPVSILWNDGNDKLEIFIPDYGVEQVFSLFGEPLDLRGPVTLSPRKNNLFGGNPIFIVWR